MWTWKWWRDVGERAIRTFASALGAWILVAGDTVGFSDINWLHGFSLSGLATVASVLMSIGTHSVTGNGPSFTSVYKEERGKHSDDSGS